jgi:metal-responsive CopG/Arc/MetJ family transcriptional regulator
MAVATRLRLEELEALDALAKKMGFKNRAETIRFIIQSVIGGA